MSAATDAFVNQNRNRLLEELKEFLRIPSISTLREHRPDIQGAASFVAESLARVGMEHVEIVPTANHPMVYADWLHAPGKPTVLCYGHYDVQPADPLELWTTPPFEPTERDGNLYGRGTATTRARCTCTSKPSKRCARSPARCLSISSFWWRAKRKSRHIHR